MGEPADAWATFRRELDRSRRYGHVFAVVVVPIGSNGSNGHAGSNGHGHNPAAAATTLRSLVRSVDTVWTAGRDAYVLLPEADRSAALAALARITREPHGLALGDGAGLAVFPEDGVTGGALLDVLRTSRARRHTNGAHPNGNGNGNGNGHVAADGTAAQLVEGLVYEHQK
jgi:hypothetical protein